MPIITMPPNSVREAKTRGLKGHFVFIAPPSFEVLEKRLLGRATETAEQQQGRLATAKEELAW